ncbi:hypothetical protein LCGC14_2716520 [marine sediment metagenome]|uniref:Uncharacterized protein n=1 Tax=marine sediment metagenome TaxID=412755 RepID=A0A0F9BKE6_9ZZZZ
MTYQKHYIDEDNPSGEEFTTLCGLSRSEMIEQNYNDCIATEYCEITCWECLELVRNDPDFPMLKMYEENRLSKAKS